MSPWARNRFASSDYPESVTDVNNRAYDTDLLDVLSERVLVGDGAMGTQLQAAGLIEAKYVRLQSG